jgi:hypothetical protein
MVVSEVIKARVTADVKRHVTDAAHREFLTESVWLRQLVHRTLVAASANGASAAHGLTGLPVCAAALRARSRTSTAARARVQVRLRPEDRLLLHERAAARGMPAATYLSALLRSHLRGLAPLPREELASLKRSIAELSAIGRNLNQLARAAHQPGRIVAPGLQEVMSMIKVCDAMRSHVKAVVRANVQSWESGYAQTSD